MNMPEDRRRKRVPASFDAESSLMRKKKCRHRTSSLSSSEPLLSNVELNCSKDGSKNHNKSKKLSEESHSQSLEVVPGLSNNDSFSSAGGACKRRKTDTSSVLNENLSIRRESSRLLSLDLSDDEEERLHSTESRKESSEENDDKSARNSSSNKRKEISLAQRMKVLDFAEEFTERETALAFGISKTAVNAIKKNKAELITLYEASKKSGIDRCRRIRSTSSEEINNKTWEWFLQKYNRKDPVTNKELQDKALSFACLAGVTKFNASKGWLGAFKKRFGITLSRSVVTVKNADSIEAYLKARKVCTTQLRLSIVPRMFNNWNLKHGAGCKHSLRAVWCKAYGFKICFRPNSPHYKRSSKADKTKTLY